MLLIKKAEQSGDIGVFTNQKFASKLSVVIFNRQKDGKKTPKNIQSILTSANLEIGRSVVLLMLHCR